MFTTLSKLFVVICCGVISLHSQTVQASTAVDQTSHAGVAAEQEQPPATSEAQQEQQQQLLHGHSIHLDGTLVRRTDELQLAQSTADEIAAAHYSDDNEPSPSVVDNKKRRVHIHLDPAVELDGLVSNWIGQENDQLKALGNCLETVEANPQVCQKFEVDLDTDQSQIFITTVLDFESNVKHSEVTYRTIDTPNHLDFSSLALIYSSPDFDATADHKFSLNGKSLADISSPFDASDAENPSFTVPNSKIPQNLQFTYTTRAHLVVMKNTVKTMTISAFSNSAKFSYSGTLKSLRQPDSVPSTMLEKDFYLQQSQDKQDQEKNQYLMYIVFTPQYAAEKLYAYDRVGKNYFVSSQVSYVALHLRYALFLDWMTSFSVDYWTNLKTLLSNSAQDGSKIIRINTGEKHTNGVNPVGFVTTVINLPGGSTLKNVKAPMSSKITVEQIEGVLNKFSRITILTKQNLNAKILVQYSDSDGNFSQLVRFMLKFLIPAILTIMFFVKTEFTIETSKEIEDLKRHKQLVSKLNTKVKSYLKMNKNFDTILSQYKSNKNMDAMMQSYDVFKQKCSNYLTGELQPLIEQIGGAKSDLKSLIRQVSEAHQQHIDALFAFHAAKIDRTNYIKQREVINNVIEQSQNQITVIISKN